MNDNLFQGLPPPSAPPPEQPPLPDNVNAKESPSSLPLPPLKSALKRSKPTDWQPSRETAVSEKRIRFKTMTDASETQVIEAMQKITSHIKNLPKFSKASRLAIQLVQAGSVTPSTSDYFFGILEAAMSSSSSCNDASVRADYHALFTDAQDIIECLNKQQRNQLAVWTIRAVVANDLFTDDSFVFSKASGRIKEAVANLPVATKDDDDEEAASLRDGAGVTDADPETKVTKQGPSSIVASEENGKVELDPFGLDALIPSTSKRDEKWKGKKDLETKIIKDEEEETKKFLKSQREGLILCLEIAAKRYKIPWCQTVIDILVKHAFDNISRFTAQQRQAIQKLWKSIREQHMRRKQGKSVSGQLDVNAFEWLQQKYSNEKISIRHSVGGGGERRCEQWLG